MVLVLHADSEDAEANSDRITDHITNGVLGDAPVRESFAGAEVTVDGAIVKITIPGDSAFGNVLRLLSRYALLPT